MKKRLLTVVLCVALAGMVTGCNGGAEGKTQRTPDGSRETDVPGLPEKIYRTRGRSTFRGKERDRRRNLLGRTYAAVCEGG